jgi:SAM-dependent methyltransferase
VSNEQWAHRILSRTDPAFIPRWTVYKNTLIRELSPESVWIDVGCGDNGMVRELKGLCRKATGVDLVAPADAADFILADIRSLPFPDACADVVTLRFVVEHLEKREDLAEILRVLKPNGKLLFLTTNRWCPVVFLPQLLPYRLKHYLITKIFNVNDTDVFPTHHQLNTPVRVRRAIPGFTVRSVQFISDLNTHRKSVFLLYLVWHMLTVPAVLNQFRANIIAQYQKTPA